MIIKSVREFLRLESASGILLLGALVIVLIIANSPLYVYYKEFINIPLQIRIDGLDLHKPIQLWMNEGLMALFFMLLALEMKREILEGELSSPSRIALPFIAAAGGIIVPIAVYFMVVGVHSNNTAGWAIPTTTDVALVLGLLALLGKRVPTNLKLFFIALSIVDDIVAVILIAVFYSHDIALYSLLIALVGIIVLIILNYKGVMRISVYFIVGLVIWIAVLKSGVHATLAGIAVGFLVPLRNKKDPEYSPLRDLEHTLNPWVAYLIVPLFVFMNAGVPFTAGASVGILHPIPMGIATGLFIGKQVGIFAATFLSVKFGISKLPKDVNWVQVYGISVLSGVGFTMSLFIASLAFQSESLGIASRQGILIGSFLATLLGLPILYLAGNKLAAKSK